MESQSESTIATQSDSDSDGSITNRLYNFLRDQNKSFSTFQLAIIFNISRHDTLVTLQTMEIAGLVKRKVNTSKWIANA